MRKQYETNYTLYLIVCDLVLTLIALRVAYHARLLLPFGVSLRPEHILLPWSVYLAVALIWLALFTLLSVYDARKTLHVHEEVQRLVLAIGTASLVFAGLLYLTLRDVPRLLFIYFVMCNGLLLVGHRLLVRLAFRYVGPRLRDAERVLIVGAGSVGQEVAARVKALEWTGLTPVGYLDDAPEKQGQVIDGLPVLGRVQDVVTVVRAHQVDEVIFALPLRAHHSMEHIVQQLQALPISVRVVPDLFDLAIFRATIEDFEGIPLIGLRDSAIDGFDRLVKRTLDLILATIILALVWPLMLVIALVIKVTSPEGPVIFKQQRLGENGRLFKMYKFRTMVPDAEQRLHEVMRRLPDGRVVHKVRDDPRVLPVGRILRRLSLDELPQLFNVLKGDMSLVGPRPELPQMMPFYEPWQWKRFSVPPGITGWWQISGRADKPMHLHTEYDLYYIQHYSPLLDLQILWRTIGVVLRGKGAY